MILHIWIFYFNLSRFLKYVLKKMIKLVTVLHFIVFITISLNFWNMKQKQHNRCLCVVTNNYCEIFCPEKFLVACVCVYTHTLTHIYTHKHIYMHVFYFVWHIITVFVLVAQSCPTLCNPLDCSPPGSFVHGILQARILEWILIPFSRMSAQFRGWARVFCIAGRFFTIWASITLKCTCIFFTL